jgi:hypothetical protein
MSKGFILLLATLIIWSAIAFMIVSLPSPEFGAYLILALLAFLSTGVVWGAGGTLLKDAPERAPRRPEQAERGGKRKRTDSSLSTLVESLTPEQLAALDAALQQRRDALDEDEQIALNRLTSDPDLDRKQAR